MEYISNKRVKIEISGVVQGVGFRPFVYQLALQHSLKGYVFNNGNGVVIELEGEQSQFDAFLSSMTTSLPTLSRIDTLQITEIPIKKSSTFSIIKSTNTDVKTMVSADISMCPDCKKEMNEPKNRRYKYPFINCTNCGPRYTIINALPYDRKNTSMQNFEMCDACKKEYEDPLNRRFHAQPISCYDCGPKLSFSQLTHDHISKDEDLIEIFSQYIKQGRSVALKGIGGFHIVCDATNEKAVAALRINKHRPTKPLAVMFKNITAIKKMCRINKKEEALILSKERPIVLVNKKKISKIAKSIAPNIDKIGVFLPYAPLHELLLNRLDCPIVATSANLSD